MKVIDELQEGFSYEVILRQAWIVVLATTMGVIRLLSRQLIFGVGRQVEVELRQRLLITCSDRNPPGSDHRQRRSISCATSDVENIRRLLGFAVLSLTNIVLVYGLYLPSMLAIDLVDPGRHQSLPGDAGLSATVRSAHDATAAPATGGPCRAE